MSKGAVARWCSVLVISATTATAVARPETQWSRARTPSSGPAESIGGYSKGCLQGAAELPQRGRGFRIARPARGRGYGHPQLVSFIKELAGRMVKRKLGVLQVGDLSQPRGGPSINGHASHQTGLDADLFYLAGRAGSLVNHRRERVSKRWSPRVPAILEMAAGDARVNRIFVHPVIKRHLCQTTQGERGWMRKLRPWWGHDSHFHVRLSCPSDSPDCEAQEPLAEDDGCADIDWWFSEEAAADRAEGRQRYRAKIGAEIALPPKCERVAGAPGRD